jgi:hypothetical protein
VLGRTLRAALRLHPQQVAGRGGGCTRSGVDARAVSEPSSDFALAFGFAACARPRTARGWCACACAVPYSISIGIAYIFYLLACVTCHSKNSERAGRLRKPPGLESRLRKPPGVDATDFESLTLRSRVYFIEIRMYRQYRRYRRRRRRHRYQLPAAPAAAASAYRRRYRHRRRGCGRGQGPHPPGGTRKPVPSSSRRKRAV